MELDRRDALKAALAGGAVLLGAPRVLGGADAVAPGACTLAAEFGLNDGDALQGFGLAFETAEPDEINAGFEAAGGSFDDIGADQLA